MTPVGAVACRTPSSNIADIGGPFSFFGDLALNDLGTVAFLAGLDAGGDGIFTGSGGPTTTIADTSGPRGAVGLTTAAPVVSRIGTERRSSSSPQTQVRDRAQRGRPLDRIVVTARSRVPAARLLPLGQQRDLNGAAALALSPSSRRSRTSPFAQELLANQQTSRIALPSRCFYNVGMHLGRALRVPCAGPPIFATRPRPGRARARPPEHDPQLVGTLARLQDRARLTPTRPADRPQRCRSPVFGGSRVPDA
jgi:hypothetical protein